MIGLQESGLLEKVKNLWDEKNPLEGEVKVKGIANQKQTHTIMRMLLI